MKEMFREWLGQNTRVPGVLACGVRFPDRECVNLSCSDDFPDSRLDQVWQSLAETASALIQHRVTATQLRWTYEEADVYFVTRGDGICLGLFTTANVDTATQKSVEKLMAGFLAMGVKS